MEDYEKLIDDSLRQSREEENESVYGELIDAAQDADKGQAKLNVSAASRDNPDTAAKALHLADQTGLPVDTVERNIDEVDYLQRTTEQQKLIDGSPVLQKWLNAGQGNAKVAHDDLPSLQKIGDTLVEITGLRSSPDAPNYTPLRIAAIVAGVNRLGNARALGEDPARAGKVGTASIAQATLGVSEMIFRTPDAAARHYDALVQAGRDLGMPTWLLPKTEDLFVPDIINFRKHGNVVANEISTSIEVLAKNFEPFQELAKINDEANTAFDALLAGDPSQFVEVVTDPASWAAFIGNAAPTLLASALSGGSPAFIAWMEAMDTASNAADFEQRTGQKIDDIEFAKAQLMVAGINTWLEKLGLDKVLNAKGLLGGVAAFVTEGTTEGLQEFFQNLAQKLTFNPEASLSQNILPAALGGGGSGLGGATVANVARQAGAAEEKRVAEQNVAKFKELQQQILDSKTFQRHKASFEAFAQQALMDDDDAHVYLDAQEAQTFFQASGEDASAVFERMGVSDQVKDALATGGDLRVPLGKFLSLADTSFYEPLLTDIRLRQGDATLRETQQASAEQVQALQEESRRILADAEKSAEAEAGKRQVQDLVQRQLVEAGMDHDTARKNAALHAAFAVVLGDKLNLPPLQAYTEQALGLKVLPGDRVPTGGSPAPAGVIFNQRRAFHGTRQAGFPRFDTNFVGTGEGATAFGWGLYFASDKNVAEWYREGLAGHESVFDRIQIDGKSARDFEGYPRGLPGARALTMLSESATVAEATDNMRQFILAEGADQNDAWNQTFEAALKFLESLPQDAKVKIRPAQRLGAVAEVELAPADDEYLDWDKPFSQQSEKVKQILISTGLATEGDTRTGEDIYQDMNEPELVGEDDAYRMSGQKKVSQMLHELGIRGIKYLEGAHRGRDSGDHNFVIFDDSDVEILQFFQSEHDLAVREHLGLWSAVERAVIDMNLPGWKKEPKQTLTPEEQQRLDEMRKQPPFTSTADPDYDEYQRLLRKYEAGLPTEAGGNIWGKLKATPGIKKEELQWLGIEDFLKSKKKFTRADVVSFIQDNGVTLEETVADEEAPSVENIRWYSEIDDDPENYEHRIEDYLLEFDEASDLEDMEFYFFNVEDWVDVNIETIVDNYISSLPDDQQAELRTVADEANGNGSQVVEWLREKVGPEVDEDIKSIMREEFEEAAQEAAAEEYFNDPYIRIFSPELDDYSAHGNEDVGITLMVNGRATEVVYSRAEAEIQLASAAAENGDLENEESETTARWEDHVMPGDYDNYREIKLKLPEIEGVGSQDGFYYEGHFPDRNIVAFMRVDDRTLKYIKPGSMEKATLPEEVPNDFMGYGQVKQKVVVLTDFIVKTAEDLKRSVARITPKVVTDEMASAEMVQNLTDKIDAVQDSVRQADFTNPASVEQVNTLLSDIGDWAAEIAKVQGSIDQSFSETGDVHTQFTSVDGKTQVLTLMAEEIQRVEREWAEGATNENVKAWAIRNSRIGFHLNTYFIDEFQSDWHSEGRKNGYAVGDVDPGELEQEAFHIKNEAEYIVDNAVDSAIFDKKSDDFYSDEVATAVKQLAAAMYRAGYTHFDNAPILNKSIEFGTRLNPILKNWKFVHWLVNKAAYEVRPSGDNWTAEEKAAVSEVLKDLPGVTEAVKLYTEAEEMFSKVEAERGMIPNAPFKGDAWLSLGLKRAVVDAVENGYEAIGWPTADELTERWSSRFDYAPQYDRKMPSIIKKLTKQAPIKEDNYWIVPITDELRARVERDGFALFQRDRGNKRGSIQFPPGNQEAIITLFENADLSTFLHESGHFFLQTYIRLADRSPEIKQDLDVLLDWFDVADPSLIGVDQHEQFARGFEAYLMEGKAPSQELQSIFDRFRAWLLQVYRSITQLGVNLTPEVRHVMDRMLATSDAIEAAEQQAELLPMFDAATDVMTQAEFEDYQREYERARDAAQRDTDKELLSRLRREATKAWKEEFDEVKARELDKLYREPANQARHFLMRGTLPDGTTPKGLQPVKLSKATLVEMYGNGEDALWRELPFGRYSVWTKDGGVHPDEIAPVFGFGSGDEMVRAMIAAKGNIDKLASDEAERIMREKYGDPDSPQAIAELALETVQNEERANFLSVELRALQRKTGQRATPRNVIKAAARRIIDATEVGRIVPNNYLRQTSKYGRLALEAALKKDYKKAADYKRKQLLNQELYRQALKAKRDAEKKVNYLRKFDRPGVRKNLARDHLAQVDSILEAYDLKKTISLKEVEKRQTLRDWIATQEEHGLEVTVPSDLIERARRRSWKELSYQELVELGESVKNIEHIARFKQKLIVGQQQRDFESTIQALVEQAISANKIKEEEFGPLSKDPIGKGKAFAREFLASHVKMEFLMQQLDGNKPNGIWWEAVFKPLADAEDAELRMSHDAMIRLNNIFAVYGKDRNRMYTTTVPTKPALGRDMKKAELLAIALNWGNEGNREALLSGEGWTQAAVKQTLDTHMSATDWQVVQNIWDLVDSFWPQISELQNRLTGVVPPKVEASEFDTPFGKLRGGYYPLVYDKERNAKAFKYEEHMTVQEMFGGNFLRPATRHGHTEARVGSDGMAVQLDLSVLTRHLVNVIHDLTHREPVLAADRILQNEQVREAIIGTSSRELYRHIRPWLAGIASDTRPINGWPEKVIAHLRRGATAVNMGWKFTTAILQPLGYLQSVELLGAKWAMRGLARFYGNPVRAKHVFNEVISKSTMMDFRMKNFDRDVRDAIRRIEGNTMLDNVQRTLYSHIGFMDMVVAIPTWLGGYEKGLAQGMSDAEAVAFADSIVRMSQSAGGAKDLAAIQRGTELQRSLTMFYSYFSVLHNLLRRRGHIAIAGGVTPSNIAATTMSFLYLVVLPAVLSELALGRGPDDDDNESFEEWAMKLSLAYPFMTMVGVRDIANHVVTGYSYQATPILDAAQTVLDAGEALAKLPDPDEEWDENDSKNVLMGAGYLLRLPARQLWISGEHLYAVLNDEEDFSLYELLYRNVPEDEK